ncbi:hypothetical protein D3C73_1068360 [compost metagenome]
MSKYIKGWNAEMSIEEAKDLAYWERNVLALKTATYANMAYEAQLESYKRRYGHYGANTTELPCGWYYDTDNNWEGWKRVISLWYGKVTYHVPDDFDMGSLQQIEPNWNGHTTEEKHRRMLKYCGVEVPDELLP